MGLYSVRALEEKLGRLGLDCLNHELLQLYPVLHEKERGEQAVVVRETAEFTQRALTEPRVTLWKACA
uniref:ERBB-3 binding protein 1-like n=1 Tax=Tanacetum cinerariifolium TaxID=118510 RepID=A0A6L2KKQ7_TANCI|nr:ERBB-3 binding protein 1-like [Tanacetum cinerariifolium]